MVRLWSIHPDLLDRAALVAGWREGLLAQKVLRGMTKGYRAHPQLERFRTLADPVAGIATWLHGLADAADARAVEAVAARVVLPPGPERLPLTDGQLALEWAHLRAKVIERDPPWLDRLVAPRPHPMFDLIPGPVAAWERAGLPEE